jgi:hypothetical protein
MEKTKVLTKIDFKTLKYCNLFLMKFQRKTKLWFGITIFLALGAAIYGYFGLEDKTIALIGLIFTLFTLYQIINLEKKLDVQLMNFFRNRSVTTQTVEIDDEKVIITKSADQNNPITYDWSFITEINEMPQYYMLMIGKGSPVIIDRSEEAILEGTKENLERIILDKASLKPYHKTVNDIARRPITFVHPEIIEEKVEQVNIEEMNADAQYVESTTQDVKDKQNENSEEK